MIYPTYDNYRELYGRYLKKGPEVFFSKFVPDGKAVLDLCSGGGQLAELALKWGASAVTMVDLAPQMACPNFEQEYPFRTTRMTMSVEDYLNCALVSDKYKPKFDIAVCRQGVNYWFKNVGGKQIANVIKPGGMFVFNTFGRKPSEEATSREYYHGGHKYREVYFMFQGKIHHVQAREGMEPHFTCFDWIDHEEFSKKLNPFFITEEHVDGPSSMWYCWRK
jgi:SAM-dependent methyltransferase